MTDVGPEDTSIEPLLRWCFYRTFCHVGANFRARGIYVIGTDSAAAAERNLMLNLIKQGHAF